MEIKIYQHDWMPGFAAFLDDGSIHEKAEAHVGLNLGAFMAAIYLKEMTQEELPYKIAESVMHEVIHAIEAWARAEFNEEKVEALIQNYRKDWIDSKG